MFCTIEENTSESLDKHGFEPVNKHLSDYVQQIYLDEAINEFVDYGGYGLNDVMSEIGKLTPKEEY